MILALVALIAVGVAVVFQANTDGNNDNTGGTPTPAPIPDNWSIFNDPVIGYQMAYPQSWFTHQASSPTAESSITSFDPEATPDRGGIPQDEIKVAVVKIDTTNGRSIASPNPVDVIEESEITVGSNQAVRRVIDGPMGSAITIRFDQGSFTYIISAYPHESDYINQLETMVSSFELTDGISLSSPQSGETISSPIDIRGQLPGNWFFEGTTTAELQTIDGQLIEQTTIQAQDSWMTEELVSFQGTLNFVPPANTNQVRLVINKANPSGLPENEATYSIRLEL
jgi:hypothetical protein